MNYIGRYGNALRKKPVHEVAEHFESVRWVQTKESELEAVVGPSGALTVCAGDA